MTDLEIFIYSRQRVIQVFVIDTPFRTGLLYLSPNVSTFEAEDDRSRHYP